MEQLNLASSHLSFSTHLRMHVKCARELFPSTNCEVIDASGKSSRTERGEAARQRSRMQAEPSHRKLENNPSSTNDDN